MRKYECAERRQFWMHAKTIADMPDDTARRNYMLSIGRESRRNLARAALILLSEGKELFA